MQNILKHENYYVYKSNIEYNNMEYKLNFMSENPILFEPKGSIFK